MNVAARVWIAKVVIKIYGVTNLPYRWLALHVLPPVARIATEFAATTEKRKQARRSQVQRELQGYMQRFEVMTAEAKAGVLSVERKQALVADHAALAEEAKAWMEVAKKPPKVKLPLVLKLAEVLVPPLAARARRRKRKTEELVRLLQRIDGPTFRFDFFLWMILPASFGVDAVGDLNEQMLSKIGTVGEEAARRWYRRQVIITVRSLVWAKVSDIATLATLVDLLNRFRRK